MNPDAAKVVANGFLKGALDVFDAMLSLPFTHETQAPEEATPEVVSGLLARFPITLEAQVENAVGVAAILFSMGDATRFASLLADAGDEPKESLSDEDRSMLKEVADPALGGGVTNLMERFGRDVEQLEEVQVLAGDEASAELLLDLMGGAATAAVFTYHAGEAFSGEAALLYSQGFEDMVPPDALDEDEVDASALAAEATLSQDEMDDILSGFGPEGMEEESAGLESEDPASSPRTAVPQGNLDMVLDIQLEATARLGRVGMPVSEILNLGPGSIIEVGHLVDEPVELLINDKLVARGDVVVVDEKFGLRITEVISPMARIETLR